MKPSALQGFGHAYGAPVLEAGFKQRPADFAVMEDLGFELTGAGEHLCLHLRKTGVNTQEVVRLLARRSGVREFDVGYCGLKDRHGVCEQWFSLYQPVPAALDLSDLPARGIELLAQTRNARKLRRGSHRANRFRLRLRELAWRDGRDSGPEARDASALQQALNARLESIARRGVPNYFGEQRFGREQDNLAQALALFSGQLRLPRGHRRGLLLSAARSQLFNAVLSRRIDQHCWDSRLEGDVWNLQGSDTVFAEAQWTSALQTRLAEFDIHPTGPLWGAGELRSSGVARALEEAVCAQWPALCEGLATAGLSQERRALRLLVSELRWEFAGSADVIIEFALPPGAYATAVLREVCFLKEAASE
jgi:tRNA pseudouridine13 synthase